MLKPNFKKSLKFLVFSAISFAFFFSIVIPNFSSEKSTSVYQFRDTVGWTDLEGLRYGIKNHITKAWTSNGVNYLVLAGGRVNNVISKAVFLMQVEPRVYFRLPVLPFPIEKAGGFIIRDSLYVVGGSSDSTTNFRNTVFKLNLKNPTTWQQKRNMPCALSEITFGTAALNDSIVYVAGGMNTDGEEVHSCLMYNPKTDTWGETENPIPYKAYGAALGVVNDSTLILIGGRTTNSVYNNIHRGEFKKGEPDKIRWSNLPPFPSGPVYNMGCWGTKIGFAFFTGGTNSLSPGKSTDTVYASTYAYIERTHGLRFIAIKPSPITHTQLDGFIIPGGQDTLFSCITAGGASTPWGPGTIEVEQINVNQLDLITLTGIIHENNTPDKMVLYQNYPNPFNPVTNIKFDIPKNAFVTLKIFDMLGREVATLVNEYMHSGSYQADWIASVYPSGVYFYKLQIESQDGRSESFTDVKKMLLVK